MSTVPDLPHTASYADIAPRPTRQEATGLGEQVLSELLLKQLAEAGVSDVAELGRRVGLAGTLVEASLAALRREALVEVRRASTAGTVRYGLTERGRQAAGEALFRDGYVGPAPVTLEQYTQTVQAQSAVREPVREPQLRRAFSGTVIDEAVLSRLGPALHSGRALFIYGPAGAGKSYIMRRLAAVQDRPVLVPHAVRAGGLTVRVFDPEFHRPVEMSEAGIRLSEGHDRRFVLCHPPLVSAGGELTLDALDLHHDPASGQYRAPLQMRANNGLLILDDLGRQRVPAEAILNRWIVPMEERRDHLHTPRGAHFVVPFDVVLVFSTNMQPAELADEAFLRRIGYKIRFGELTADDYGRIWHQVCAAGGVASDAEALPHALALHRRHGTPLLACHPRDLIGLAVDRCRFHGGPSRVTPESLDWAWENYFVPLH